jgi:catechol 2,3-dioxygenase-like lactoylglutathione lyase family enzyme
MAVSGMNHFTILTDDVEATVAFYGEFLGLVPGPRPSFGFAGAWLYAGGQPILHVVGDKPRAALRPGVIDHMAFTASGLAATLAQLAARGIAHDCRRLPGFGTWQVFFDDPNGARVELDFAAEEAGPHA